MSARIVYSNAMRQIIAAGLASTYTEASARYGDRLVRAGNCNMVTVASLKRLIAEGVGA